MSNLTCQRQGLTTNFEFYDEPTTWVSGSDALFTVLAERAERHGKVILLADKRQLDFGGFAGRITITKHPEIGSFLS